jgi:hypothetical protein
MIDAERLASMSPEECATELIRLRRQIDALELDFSQLAAAFSASTYWYEDGSNTAIDWIRHNCHMTQPAAGTRVAVGEQLAWMPESAQAMQVGDIGFAHLSIMARTAEAVGNFFDERALLPIARECSAGKFHYKADHYRHSVQPKAYAAKQEEQAKGNRLRLNTAEDGSLLISGILDPVNGAAVRGALEPLARPSGRHDYRDRDQRMADALVEIIMHGGNHNVQLQVTSSIETLLGLTGAPGADMEFSLPISSKTVERWACDCSVTRVLMQDSMVIDVGRAKRVISGPTKRALHVRDGHCVWPRCERPASWCDGHHRVHWIHGGPTDLDNLLLLCHRHHRMVHEGNWQIAKTDDGGIMPIAPLINFVSPMLDQTPGAMLPTKIHEGGGVRMTELAMTDSRPSAASGAAL